MNAQPSFDLERSAPAGKPAAKADAIVVRDMRFNRKGTPPRWWLAGDPVGTAWHNALSATFPRGEAFFIESVRAFRDDVPPKLAAEIRTFISQEVNHSREHLAFNRAAVDAGYDLSRIDAHVTQMLELAKGRPPIVNLAATMALEHFTAILANLLLTTPEMLEGAEPEVAAMWRWHAVEEIEHKAVAYDTFLYASRNMPRRRRWLLKSITMLSITLRFVSHRIADAVDLLAQDGITGWKAKARVLWYVFGSPGYLRRVFPAWASYFLPGFHPWKHDDRHLIPQAEAGLQAFT
ncbi:MAG: metal-dependent hydrolase [Novosphingobium sp.]